MKTLFKNDHQEILLDEDLGLFEQLFLSHSDALFGKGYINEIIRFGDILEEHQTKDKKYKFLIINTLSGGPTMEPMVQEYMHDVFYPRIAEIGITTKAYCLGPEIIAKLSIELTSENNPKSQFNYRFFATREEGVEWLKSL